MKGKPGEIRRPGNRSPKSDPAEVALALLGALVSDPERLGRFLALTGLDPGSIRAVAKTPAFLSAILDHVSSDERLLVEVTAEVGLDPFAVERARQALSPDPDWTT